MDLKNAWDNIYKLFDLTTNIMIECSGVSEDVISDNEVADDVFLIFNRTVYMMRLYYEFNDELAAEKEYQKIISEFHELYFSLCIAVGLQYIDKIHTSLESYDDDTIIKAIPAYYSLIEREIEDVKKRLKELEIIVNAVPEQKQQLEKTYEAVIILKNHYDTIIKAQPSLKAITINKKKKRSKENVVNYLVGGGVGAAISAAASAVLHFLGVL